MGGCAMIGQSMINVTSGGRGRASGIIAALALLSFILWLSDLIEIIPIAALVGVMFMVVIGTFAWKSFKTLFIVPKTDAFVIVLVTTITVLEDLAVAVISGIIVSALMFAWENAKRIRARKSIKEDGTKVYEIWGPLFFGSITAFNEKFDVSNDPKSVEIDFIESKVSDHSGIEALEVLIGKYQKAGKNIKLTHLSKDCKEILLKANPLMKEAIEDNVDDPRYFVLSEVNSVDS
jgi:SulP family sulfate permease